MTKTILIALMLALIASVANAHQPEKGYRGFIDWNNDLTTYTEFYHGNRVTYYYSGASTSHGYQFNPSIFLGAGISAERCSRNSNYIVPLFLQIRTDQKFGRLTPFGDLKIGYSLTDGGGIYLSPTLGYRFNWGRRLGINLGLGVTVKGSKIDMYDINPEIDPSTGYLMYKYIGTEHHTKVMFAFRVGIDF